MLSLLYPGSHVCLHPHPISYEHTRMLHVHVKCKAVTGGTRGRSHAQVLLETLCQELALLLG